MSVTPLMLSFVEDELSRMPQLIDRAVAATLSQLQQAPRAEPSNRSERQLQADVYEVLQRSSPLFTQVFCDALRTNVMADARGMPHQASGDAAQAESGFQLLDEDRIETDIEISRAAQAIDLAAEWELRDLQTFTSTLIGQDHVSAKSNPLRPPAYAQALWDATCAVTPVAAQGRLLFRTATDCLAKQLKLAWAGACSRLESQGVEPSVYRTLVHAPSAIVLPGPLWKAEPRGLGQLLSRMPAGKSGRMPVDARQTSGTPAAASASEPRFSQAFEDVLARLETLLSGHAERPLPAEGSSRTDPRQLTEFAQSLLAQTHDGIDRQIVDLLSRIFDSVLSDEQLSAPVRAVLARLQVSALRVALTDPEMLNNDNHPVWLLMNRIAQAAQVWPLEADPRAASLLTFSDSLAAEIAATEQPTGGLYRIGLARLEEHLAAQLQAQREAAQGVIEGLALSDRREVLRMELSAQFSEQFRSTRAAPRVLVFMTEEWPRVVAESILRFGVDSEHTLAYMQTADDLHVSLNLKVNAQNRLQLFSLLPGLLKRLRAGMALIAFPEDEQQAVLDDLMATHTGLLGFAARYRPPAATTDDTTPTTSDDDSRTHRQPTDDGFPDSLIDVKWMDTVPAELLPTGDSAHTMPAELAEAIIAAAPCQWFLRGRWQTVQLLWRSESGQFLLFAGETPGCPHSITGDALGRLGREGLLKSLPSAGLLQRAVERVGRHLGDFA